MNWKHFGLAALVVGAAMIKQGVPWLAVAAGAGLVGLVGVMRMRRAG